MLPMLLNYARKSWKIDCFDCSVQSDSDCFAAVYTFEEIGVVAAVNDE